MLFTIKREIVILGKMSDEKEKKRKKDRILDINLYNCVY